ncbi:metallophosphoesterase [Oscillatoria sp. CS-180]|uniref:metallophosphoesterase family protein n=1 Tax=Oscillatoria sp. CS-180 TaxID=3021720 RepID=UPI00232B07A2|nr:metallophosphoesterase [Oscillatoria sp. CS-180]MDB9526052.1 metallophosphoesterase [Oscillatoria sp. CS-180]
MDYLWGDMRWKRFLTGVMLGVIASFCIACTQTALQSSTTTSSPADSSIEQTETVETTAAAPEPDPTPQALPQATQQMLASLGQELVDPPRGDLRMVVMSDLNGVYGSTDYDPEIDKTMALIPFWNPDLVVCSGDMVAGQDLTLTPDQIQAMWTAFDDHVMAPLRAAGLPYGFTIGNHDASSALGINDVHLFQQERDLATAYWQAPEHDPGVDFVDRFEFPFYYAFRHGDIFFVSWDASSSQIPEDKLAWVEEALASEAAQNARMRILLGHLPLYAVAVGRDEPGEVMDNADQLQAMLEKYDVHTYISGHHHAYYPGHRGNLQLLHMGVIGSGPRPLIDSDLPPRKVLTVLDVDFDAPDPTRYTTYDIQTMEVIEYSDLPRFLTGHNGRVLRRDVDETEISADEQAFCEAMLGAASCTS